MSYLVLARKWRPQSFDEVIGQGHITRTLQNALSSNKVAHALLFSGPRGVGKTSVARIVAKALNCTQGPAPNPCNSCQICKEITSGSCVDVNEIDGASNRGIDEIRQLRDEIRFQPVLCRFRIYIIDEVHMLTNEAFNALLKTLEEPPAHAYFIFATTEPRKIPETIHSRCQHYEFRRLSESVLTEHLDRIVAKENLGLSHDATSLLAYQAQGSVRDSLSLLDQVVAYGARDYQEVCQALGVAGLSTIEALAEALLRSDTEKALALIHDVYEMGIDLQRLAKDLLHFLRDLAVIKKVDPKTGITITRFSKERISRLAESFSEIPFSIVIQAMEILASGLDDLYRSLTPRINLEILAMRICSITDFASMDELLEGIGKLLRIYEETDDQRGKSARINKNKEQKTDSHLGKEPADEDTVSEAAPSKEDSQTSAEEVVKRWPEFVEFVKGKSPGLGSVLDACLKVECLENGQIRGLCAEDVRGEMLCSQEKSSQIAGLASTYFNHPVNIKFVMDEKGCTFKPQKGKNGASSNRQKNSRQELINNPLVQEAINIFQARISNVTLYNRRNNKKTRS